MRASDTELLIPASAEEAAQGFGDGRGVTVFAGGTILMPDIAYGRYPRGGRTLMLERADLERIGGDGAVSIGAMVRLSALADSGLEPLAAAAARVAHREVRAQATLGGNLCAPPGPARPRGDLQAPLIAVGARVRTTGADGERTEPVEDLLAGLDREPRLVLAVEFERPERSAYISQRRAHAHSYSVMSVACARRGDSIGVAAGGAGPRAIRLSSVERALADGASPREAAGEALQDVEPRDDALASAWYRRAVLPVLIGRALEQLQGG